MYHLVAVERDRLLSELPSAAPFAAEDPDSALLTVSEPESPPATDDVASPLSDVCDPFTAALVVPAPLALAVAVVTLVPVPEPLPLVAEDAAPVAVAPVATPDPDPFPVEPPPEDAVTFGAENGQ